MSIYGRVYRPEGEEARDDAVEHRRRWPGKATLSERVQRKGAGRRIARRALSLDALVPPLRSGPELGGRTASEGIGSRKPADVAEEGFKGAAHEVPHRAEMERSFGVSFAGVRAYSDGPAQKASEDLNAHAYTMGDQVAFRSPSPDKATVAHELTHVVQQTGCTPSMKSTDDGGIDTSGEAQADAVESAVTAGKPASSALDGVARKAARPARKEDEDGDKKETAEEREKAAGASDAPALKALGPARKRALSRLAIGPMLQGGINFNPFQGYVDGQAEIKLLKCPPIKIPTPSPFVNIRIAPSVILKLGSEINWQKGEFPTKAGVQGTIGIGVSIGITHVLEGIAELEGSAEGVFDLTITRTSWAISGNIGFETVFQIGVEAFDKFPAMLQFGKLDIGKLYGFKLEKGKGAKGLHWEWGDQLKPFFESVNKLAPEANKPKSAGQAQASPGTKVIRNPHAVRSGIKELRGPAVRPRGGARPVAMRAMSSSLADSLGHSVGDAGPASAMGRGPGARSAADVADDGFKGSAHEIPHRAEMERSFGVSFAGVRAYSDGPAQKASQDLNAHAYTMGDQVAFRSSSPDKATVAHELTHVVQQTGGTPSMKSTDDGGIDTSGETQAEAVESAVTAGKPASSVLGGVARKAARPARKEDDNHATDEEVEAGKKQDGVKSPALKPLGSERKRTLARKSGAEESKWGAALEWSPGKFEAAGEYKLVDAEFKLPIPITGVPIPLLFFVVRPSIVAQGTYEREAIENTETTKKHAVGLAIEGNVFIGLSAGEKRALELHAGATGKAKGGGEFSFARSGARRAFKYDTWQLTAQFKISACLNVGFTGFGGFVSGELEGEPLEFGAIQGVDIKNGNVKWGSLAWNWSPQMDEMFKRMKALSVVLGQQNAELQRSLPTPAPLPAPRQAAGTGVPHVAPQPGLPPAPASPRGSRRDTGSGRVAAGARPGQRREERISAGRGEHISAGRGEHISASGPRIRKVIKSMKDINDLQAQLNRMGPLPSH